MSSLIPQSTALAEASADSLTELMSRDPQQFTRDDRSAIVTALRAQRTKWEASEAEGTKPKAPKASVKSLIAKASAGDLGL